MFKVDEITICFKSFFDVFIMWHDKVWIDFDGAPDAVVLR